MRQIRSDRGLFAGDGAFGQSGEDSFRTPYHAFSNRIALRSFVAGITTTRHLRLIKRRTLFFEQLCFGKIIIFGLVATVVLVTDKAT
jgi:hypothetical protein